MAATRNPKQLGEMSPNQVGRIFGVTGEAVKIWIYNQKLQATKHTNGYWKITKADIEEFIKERQAISRRQILLVSMDAATEDVVRSACERFNCDNVVCDGMADAIIKAHDYNAALLVVDCTLDETWSAITRIGR